MPHVTDFLFVDFETASALNIKQVGHMRYARDASTRVLMLGYGWNDFAPGLWDATIASEMPAKLRAKILDPNVMLVAHNAPFERAIFKYVLGIDIPVERWICTQGMALSLSLPGDLDKLTHDALNLGDEFAKSKEGKRLINLFCKPRKLGRKAAADAKAYNDRESHPVDWERFCAYCKLDVIAERKVYRILRKYFPNFDTHQSEWQLDQEINDRGLPVDVPLIEGALKIVADMDAFWKEELREISGLANPNSPVQAKNWLKPRGYPFDSLKKNRVKIALKDFKDTMTEDARKFLRMRLKATRASVKKFAAFARAHTDGWIQGMFQFCGAGRTGRWAGRIAQLQNLAKALSHVEKSLDWVRPYIRAGDTDTLHMIFGNALDVLVSSVRSVMCAPKGHEFAVADLASIELVVAAWGTKCEFWLDVLRRKRDPYCAYGEHLYGVPYDELYAEYKAGNKKRRNDAKPGALGFLYRLGGGELRGDYPDQERTGLWGYAQSMGVELTREFSHDATKIARELSPEIVQEWYDLENAAKACINTREPQQTPSGVRFDYKSPFMRMRLPSGRYLFYAQPKILNNKIKTGRMVPVFDGKGNEIGSEEEFFEKMSISYMGIHQTSKKWVRVYTHGGKLFENWVQATARDILVHGLFKARDYGFKLCGHVHDEAIALVRRHDIKFNVEALVRCLSIVPDWAPGLPLSAAGFQSEFYKKD